MNIFDHDDCLRKCAEIRASAPKVFRAYDEMRRTGGTYPPVGSAARKLIDEYERLSARAGRWAAGS